MHDFSPFHFKTEGFPPRLVYKKGQGPAVIVMHELPGMVPECVDLARQIADAGFTAYLPLLFGKADRPLSTLRMLQYSAQLCISREFYLFKKHCSSPITDWLRSLCQEVHQDCKGKGVGVIGMCLTGGFVLSLMADESVIAPVMSQPALPLGCTSSHKAALGVSQEDLRTATERAKTGVPLLALRFSEDCISPADKFQTLRQAFDNPSEVIEVIEDSNELCWKRGASLETIEVNSKRGNPFGLRKKSHSVLTLERRASGHPTHRVFQRVIAFLQEQCQSTP